MLLFYPGLQSILLTGLPPYNMRREVPLTITFITGFLIIIGFFIPHEPIGETQTVFLEWYSIIVGFTMVVGLITLSAVHMRLIRRHHKDSGIQ